MDRIDGNLRNIPLQPKAPASSQGDKKNQKTSSAGKTGFLNFFKTEEQKAQAAAASAAEAEVLNEAQIEALLDEIYDSGRDLAQYPSPENVQKYKQTIGRFLRSVVQGSLELTEVEGRLRKDMKRPKYALIQVINDKLDKLGAYVLQNQRDKLELLHKVDELHGLLVDLRH